MDDCDTEGDKYAGDVGGGDVIVNGAFTTDANWDKDAGWTIDVGDSNTAACDGTNSAFLTQTVAPLTVGTWYKATMQLVSRIAGIPNVYIGLRGTSALTTPSNVTYTNRALSTAFRVLSTFFNGTIDNITCVPLVLTELFSSITATSKDVLCSVSITFTTTFHCTAGIIFRLDSTSSPANFLLATINYQGTTGGIVYLDRCVGGTYTQLIGAAVTYSAGANLVVSCDGTAVRVHYNNALVGTEQTVSDAGIVNNTLHGLFSTDPSNTFDNFLVMPRGNGGEYAALDLY